MDDARSGRTTPRRAAAARELAVVGAVIHIATPSGGTARRILGRAAYRELQRQLRELWEYEARLERDEYEAKR